MKFRHVGPVSILHLNTRKEGDNDDKVLAVDVKFEARMEAIEVFASFDADLLMALYTDIGAVRAARAPLPALRRDAAGDVLRETKEHLQGVRERAAQARLAAMRGVGLR